MNFNDWEIKTVKNIIETQACEGGRVWFLANFWSKPLDKIIADAPDGYMNWLLSHLPRYLAPKASEHVDLLVDALYQRWPNVAWTWERWSNNPDIFYISYVVRETGHTATRICRHIGREERAEFIRIVLEWAKVVS